MRNFAISFGKMFSTIAVPSSLRLAFNTGDWRPTATEWELAMQCVQREEKERILRFVFFRDAKASLVGRLFMRKAVSECIGVPYDKIQFSRTEAGKPFVSNYLDIVEQTDFNFNVSHNGDYCVIAAESSCRIGIDVMKIEYRGHRPVPEYFDLMRKQFSDEEMNFITYPGLEKEQLARFYRIWCLKESFVKADGTGISRNLSAVSFHCRTPFLTQENITEDTQLNLNGYPAEDWAFEETLLDGDHCIAVAIETKRKRKTADGERRPVLFSVCQYEELMKNCIPFETMTEAEEQYFYSKNSDDFTTS